MFVKTSSAKVVGFSQKANARTAGKRSVGSFEYEPNTDGNYLYVAARACTADVPNLNYDISFSNEFLFLYFPLSNPFSKVCKSIGSVIF